MTMMQITFNPKPVAPAKPWYFEGHRAEPLHRHLHNREHAHTHKRRRPSAAFWTAASTPSLLRPTELHLENHDKVFCSLWISHEEILLGTKCNRLIILNVQTNRRCEIPIVSIPDTLVTSATTSDKITKGGLPTDQSLLGRTRDDVVAATNCSGIRSLAINPSRTLLAVGAGSPVQVMIYSLPTFEPYAIFRGHTDCCFSLDWLDDTRLVTGSRDGTLRVWNASENVVAQHPVLLGSSIQVHEHIVSRPESRGRIRDLKLDRTRDEIMTLSTEGYIKLWDARTVQGVRTFEVRGAREPGRPMVDAVCMARNERAGLYAVGSLAHMSFVDPRAGQKSIVHDVASLDEGCGVRSLCFDNYMVTAGGGAGRVSFYDLRAQKYLVVDDKTGANYLQSTGGWLCQDVVYQTHFMGRSWHNAIYTLAYDDERTRLFVAGGPLDAALKGSYAALLW